MYVYLQFLHQKAITPVIEQIELIFLTHCSKEEIHHGEARCEGAVKEAPQEGESP